MELSIPYEFTSYSGHRFVLGNSDAAAADIDYIGHLDPEAGITGLLDGADVRPGATAPLTQANGVRLGRGLLGGRSGTVQGKLNPNVTVAVRELLEEKARVALYDALRSDLRMAWTPSAPGSIRRMLRVRNVGRPDFRGRQPKTFLFTLASADYHVLSVAPASVVVELAGGVGPVFGQMTNLGSAWTWPRHELVGPITGPIAVYGPVPGELFVLDLSIAAGKRVLVWPQRAAVVEETIGDPSSRINRYGALAFETSVLWRLPPGGPHPVAIGVAASGAGARLTTTWHHAWP